MRTSRLPPVPLVVFVVGILLLALSLAWHLVGMDHGVGMGLLGAGVATLAAGLAALSASGAWDTTRISGVARADPPPAGSLFPAGRSRPPPREGTVLRR